MTHTPGPWILNHASIGQASIESEQEHGVVNNGWIIARVYGYDPERHANGHLIAAAADLLAAINALLANDGSRGVFDAINLAYAHQLAEAAITKATTCEEEK